MLCLRSALSAWPSGGPPLAGDAWVHPELAALRDYWLSKCGARRMPARSAIDPLEMKRWLGHLVLHEVIDGGRDFLCKVYGSVLAEMLHHDLTGRKLSDLPPDRVEVPRAELRKVVATGEPLYVVRRIVYPGNEFIDMGPNGRAAGRARGGQY